MKTKPDLGVSSHQSKLGTIMIWVIILASIGLSSLAYWKAEIIHQGLQDGEAYKKFYLFSVVGLMFALVLKRVSIDLRHNLILTLFAVMFTLYTLEAVLQVTRFAKPLPRTIAASKMGINFDHRSIFEVVEALNQTGTSAKPCLSGRFLSDNPIHIAGRDRIALGGLSNTVTVCGNENGQRAVYLTDRYGFNNPGTEWDKENIAGVLIGDSFTAGSEVQDDENIASWLRQLTGYSFINLGVSGSSLLTSLATLKEYATTLRPKAIFWLYFEGNDLAELNTERLNPFLLRYLDANFTNNLINYQTDIDQAILEKLAEHSHGNRAKETTKTNTTVYLIKQFISLGNLRHATGFDDIGKSRENLTTEINLVEPILQQAKTHLNLWGGKLYFVYLPTYARYKRVWLNHDEFLHRKKILSTVNRLDIPIIDIHEKVLKPHADPLSLFPLRIHGHYNPSGYREVANTIIQFNKH